MQTKTTRLALNPAGVRTPRNAYSQLVRLSGFSELVSVAGQLGVDEHGVLAGDFAGQVRLALANLNCVLAAADLDLGQVLHLRHYVVAGQDVAVVNAERRALLGSEPPASTLVIVAALADPAALYEVDALAAR